MINPHWLEQPMSRINFHGLKDVRAIEVLLYFLSLLLKVPLVVSSHIFVQTLLSFTTLPLSLYIRTSMTLTTVSFTVANSTSFLSP